MYMTEERPGPLLVFTEVFKKHNNIRGAGAVIQSYTVFFVYKRTRTMHGFVYILKNSYGDLHCRQHGELIFQAYKPSTNFCYCHPLIYTGTYSHKKIKFYPKSQN